MFTKKILLILILAFSTLIVLSQQSLSSEDKKIIANTFLENNYLHTKVDSLESLNNTYQIVVNNYDSVNLKYKSVVFEKDGVIAIKDKQINSLYLNLKDARKENVLNKVKTGITAGVLTIGLGGLLYILIAK